MIQEAWSVRHLSFQQSMTCDSLAVPHLVLRRYYLSTFEGSKLSLLLVCAELPRMPGEDRQITIVVQAA